jgi:hypothetical protein
MHHRLLRVVVLAVLGILLIAASAGPVAQSGNGEPGLATVRFATFNASLNRNNAGELRADLMASTDLSRPGVVQAHNVAEIIQRIAPDVVLINEFDFDPQALDLFANHFLAVPHGDAAGIQYPHRFIAPSNTGIPSGFDLDNSGGVGEPNESSLFVKRLFGLRSRVLSASASEGGSRRVVGWFRVREWLRRRAGVRGVSRPRWRQCRSPGALPGPS